MIDTDAALAYAQRHRLEAFVVTTGATIVAHACGDDYTLQTPHKLFSGTKSFWGVAATVAQNEGLLRLDEPVADTIDAWRDDPWKRRVTLRMLLSLTAGHAFGGLGSGVPTYERALEMPLATEPGSTFTYTGISLQVFGAAFARKLHALGLTPHEYLIDRVLQPAGATVATWRTLPDGTQPLPTGASMSAADWTKYGRYVLQRRDTFDECFRGTPAGPRYGLGWWLEGPHDDGPCDIPYASGSGGQGLYLLPAFDTIAVHFGAGASYKHDAMLRRLTGRIGKR
jgi:CubicO group peptidase (beta-lactamase class C family)